MGYAASLMLAWTILLVWANRDPLPRRFIAAFTLLVIYGLIAAEIMAVRSGHLEAWRMIPTWVLQVCLPCPVRGQLSLPMSSEAPAGLRPTRAAQGKRVSFSLKLGLVMQRLARHRNAGTTSAANSRISSGENGGRRLTMMPVAPASTYGRRRSRMSAADP